MAIKKNDQGNENAELNNQQDTQADENTDQKQAKEKTQEKPQRLIYCGPNLPGGVLFKYQVFKGGYPEHLKETFEKCPAIKSMFVAPGELNEMRIKKDKAGTYENKLLRDIEKFIAGGAK